MTKAASDFWIGFIAWKDFTPHGQKLITLEETLNQLALASYGVGIKHFNFIPIALRPDNRIHEEEIHYSTRKKEVNIQLKLDYQEVINAGTAGFLPLVGQLLLRGIDEVPKERIQNFDWLRFRQDVQNLLFKNGWLSPIHQA